MKLDKKTLCFSIAVVIIGVIAMMFLSEGSEPYRTLLFFRGFGLDFSGGNVFSIV